MIVVWALGSWVARRSPSVFTSRSTTPNLDSTTRGRRRGAALGALRRSTLIRGGLHQAAQVVAAVLAHAAPPTAAKTPPCHRGPSTEDHARPGGRVGEDTEGEDAGGFGAKTACVGRDVDGIDADNANTGRSDGLWRRKVARYSFSRRRPEWKPKRTSLVSQFWISTPERKRLKRRPSR